MQRRLRRPDNLTATTAAVGGVHGEGLPSPCEDPAERCPITWESAGTPSYLPGVRDDDGHRESETETAVLLAAVVLATVLWALAIGGAFTH